jgi:hypothetical protein
VAGRRFATQPEEFILDGLKKLEQRSHKSVCGAQGGICRANMFSSVACFLYKAKDLATRLTFRYLL